MKRPFYIEQYSTGVERVVSIDHDLGLDNGHMTVVHLKSIEYIAELTKSYYFEMSARSVYLHSLLG